MPKQNEPRRNTNPQSHQTTKAAQLIARVITASTVNGRVIELQPLEAALTPRTRSMLAAVAKNGGSHGR